MSGPWLKSLTCFSLVDFPLIGAAALGECLHKESFVPCSTLERERHGFTPAFGQEEMVRQTASVMWLQMRSERKAVPGATVKRLLEERIKVIETEEARKVGRKEKKEMKQAVVDELVAIAPPTQSTVTVLLDQANARLIVGSSSNKVVERVLSLMLKCVDGLNFARVDFGNVVTAEMANLLLGADSGAFATDSSLILKGPGSPAATVRFAKHSLSTPEVASHLNAGMRPVELELGWDGRLSFVLTENFGIKKLTYLELVTTSFESSLPEDPIECLDAVLLLQAGEIAAVVDELTAWFSAAQNAMPAEA